MLSHKRATPERQYEWIHSLRYLGPPPLPMSLRPTMAASQSVCVATKGGATSWPEGWASILDTLTLIIWSNYILYVKNNIVVTHKGETFTRNLYLKTVSFGVESKWETTRHWILYRISTILHLNSWTSTFIPYGQWRCQMCPEIFSVTWQDIGGADSPFLKCMPILSNENDTSKCAFSHY